MKQILTAETDSRAMDPLRELSSIAFLEKLYVDAETPENSKMLAKLLLLTIAQHSRKAGRKEEAVKALLELKVCTEDACINIARICNTECKCCRCVMQSIYDDMDPTINELKSYWHYKCIRYLAWLVENDENLSPYCSKTMEEAFLDFRRTFFMSFFTQLYVGHLPLIALKVHLENFIEFSKNEKCRDGCFLQEHQTRALHIRTVLQEKMNHVDECDKGNIYQMLERIDVLDALMV
jgi:hypothetical protein